MRRTLRAFVFITVAPIVTCPSPAIATAAPRRTAITVVLVNFSACMGVRPPVDLLQLLHAHVGVHLGSGQAGVAEQLLHGADVRPTVEQMRGEGMAEGVRGHALSQVRPREVFAEYEPHPPVGHPPAPLVDEKSVRRLPRRRGGAGMK